MKNLIQRSDWRKFGFGCMRLPLLQAEDSTSFDYEKIEALFDAFLERSFRYFDTAFTYHGFRGEEAVKRAPSICRCGSIWNWWQTNLNGMHGKCPPLRNKKNT